MLKYASIFTVVFAVSVYGCASLVIVDKAEIKGENEPSFVIQAGGGMDTRTARSSYPDGSGGTTEYTYTMSTFNVEGGLGYSYGVTKFLEARGEVPLGAFVVQDDNGTTTVFFGAPRGVVKLAFGGENFRIALKGGIGLLIGNASTMISYGGEESRSTMFMMYPYFPMSVMAGFGSPEKFTLGLSAPPPMLWGAYHLSSRLSLWLGLSGYAMGSSFNGYTDSETYIAVHGGIGYWLK